MSRRLQRIKQLDPRARLQIMQILDACIKREELKQRIGAARRQELSVRSRAS